MENVLLFLEVFSMFSDKLNVIAMGMCSFFSRAFSGRQVAAGLSGEITQG